VTDERAHVVSLIDDAVKSGARIERACAELGLTARTVQRWRTAPGLGRDARRGPSTPPKQKLSPDERAAVLGLLNSPAYRDLAPAQVVAQLADEHVYVASEATMYRLLREHELLAHRHSTAPRKHQAPKELIADGPNQVWSWDITYLPSNVRGQYFYLYLFVDVWSRKIMRAEVHPSESGDIGARMLRDACREHQVPEDILVLHSDNGAPMKAATMLATMRALGVASSFSRPRVSDDNPFSEALFRTLKYVPDYPRMVPTPALFTSTSTSPTSSWTLATRAASAARSARSHAITKTSSERWSRESSSASSRSRSVRRATNTRRRQRSATIRAISRPMPLDAPVTRTVP
jgi:transposase InsO family protein